MSIGDKMSILGDFRKVLQDFLAPELGELKVRLDALADGQKAIIHDMREGFKAQTESRQDMEARLLREIKNSEEKIRLTILLSETSGKLEQVTRENEQLKREKTQ